ncbi:UBAP1 family protein [Megaselia abdita]
MSDVGDVPMFITRKLQPPNEVDIPVDVIKMFKDDNDKRNEELGYDFTLERYVCTKISEWVRNTEIDRMNRDERVRLKEIERARQNEEKHKQLLTAVQYDDLSSGEDDEEAQPDVEPEKKFSPTHISFDTILQPTIVPNQVNSSSLSSSSCKLLNYSDFETIESSPFDNVELKTINDLDILAQILKTTSVHPTDRQEEKVEEARPDSNGDHEAPIEKKEEEETPYPASSVINPPVFPPYFSPNHNGTHTLVQNVHLIPDILKGLNNEIFQSECRRSQSTDRDSLKTYVEKSKPKENIVDDHFTSLSPKSQNLVTSICQMGFPMERVIKIVGKLGEKKKEARNR